MKIIGITGGTGTGKTTALNVLRDMDAYIVDCDELYHELLVSSADMLREINERFPGVVNDGVLDRKKLGSYVFSDKEALRELGEITHPYVERAVISDMERERELGRKIFAIDAIALLEGGLVGMCDVVVGITAPVEVRVERLIAREGISEEYARLRISAQHDEKYYEERCSTVIRNDGSCEEFKNKCRKYFESVTER